MNPIKLLAYIVALIIIIAIAYSLLGETFKQRYTPIPVEHIAGLDYKPKRIECPYLNSSDVYTYAIDLLRGLDVDGLLREVLYPDLTKLDVERYILAVANLSILLAVPLCRLPIASMYIPCNGSAYQLVPLPVSEEDREGLANKTVFICAPPAMVFPELLVLNTSDSHRLNIFSSRTYRISPMEVLPVLVSWVPATPPPYAELEINVSTSVLEKVVVTGFAHWLSLSYEKVGEDSWGYCYPWYNETVCIEYIHDVYNISWSYVLGYRVNNTVAFFRYTPRSGRFRASWLPSYVYDSDGYFLGFGPLARAVLAVTFGRRLDDYRYDNTTRTYYYVYRYYLDKAYVETYWRGFEVDTKVNASIALANVKQVTGFTPTEVLVPRWAVVEPQQTVELEVLFEDMFDMCALYKPDVEGVEGVEVCLSGVLGTNMTRVSHGGDVVVRYRVLGDPWAFDEWYTVKPLPYRVEVEKRLAPPPTVAEKRIEVGRISAETAIKRIAGALADFIGRQTPLRYRTFVLWSLATQIPIGIGLCGGATDPIYALSIGCGSEEEKVEILSGILRHLGIESEVKDVVVRTAKGLEVSYERGKAVVGYIDDYPRFYELVEERCTEYVARDFMLQVKVVYDTVQNNVFSVLDRIEWMD